MSTTPSIQPTTPTASYTTNANTATQSQTPGAWYNPFPNPYPYGFPTNGGNMYNFGGAYGNPFGAGYGNPYGAGYGNPYGAGYGNPYGAGYGVNPVAGNIYGGYDYQNNNPNSALPGYGYQSAIAPTSFTSPLSGNGVAPNSAGNRIYQEHFAADNAPLVTMASGAVGAFATGMTWAGTIGKSRIFNNKFGIFLQAGITLAGAVAGAVMGNRFMGDKLKAYYTGLDYNENGNMDGSYTSQRGYDVNLLKIL